MPRRNADTLTLRRPLPAIPDVASLDVRVSYPTNCPEGWTVALLRLPNDYYVVVGRSSVEQWAVVYRHYVVPGTGAVDPRPCVVDPRTGAPAPTYVRWHWTDGGSISSVLKELAPLEPGPDLYIGKGRS
ncbi:hypothetical protein ACF09H_32090 [Streptomyces sp. NPDC014983]|uniref:hypothetical protein n=1 Tax=Streptomyces sp. NPDC014983 TaxID=3364933 RepID=UPI0036FD0350